MAKRNAHGSGSIHVRRQLQKSRKGGQYYFSTPKSGKGRVVAMPETVRRALKELQKELQKEQRLRRLQAGGSWMPSGGLSAEGEEGVLIGVVLGVVKIACIFRITI